MTDRIRKLLDLVLSPGRDKPLAPLDASDVGLGGDRTTMVLFVLLLIMGFAARLGLAIAFPSVYFPDETYQYWEQGYRLVFGYGIVPWEYTAGIRSWVVPGFIGGIIWVVNALGGGPDVWQIIVQAILSLASLGIVVTSFLWVRRLSGTGAALLAAFIASFWYEFLYFSPKPLTEIIAASALFPAAYLLCATPGPTRRMIVSGGLLLGLSFTLRFHLAPAIFVIGLATMLRLGWPKWLIPAGAGLAVVLASGMLDWPTWGAPFHSYWQSFSINVLQDRASSFGTHPVFWYLLLYANAWPGIVIVMLGLILVGARRASLLFLVPLVILLSHTLISHKEYRFLYPALPFFITLASIGTAELFALTTRGLSVPMRRWAFGALALAWFLTSGSLAATEGFLPKWTKRADHFALMAKVRETPAVCALGIEGAEWAETPGYSGLARDIPIYFLRRADYDSLSPAFNALIHKNDKGGDLPEGFVDLECREQFCLAMRPGVCTPQPDKQILIDMLDWT